MSKPIVSTDVLGYIKPHELDKYLERYLDDHLEEAYYRMLALRGGRDPNWDFQDKLTDIWNRKNNIGILRVTPAAGDTIRYSEFTPEYTRVKIFGYTQSSKYDPEGFLWVMTSELVDNDD
jgi:hypothetical protein